MLVGILHTASTTTYGLTNRHVPMYMFQPHDAALIPRRVAWKDADRLRNHWVVVNPTEEVGRMPRAEFVKDLGPCGDWEAERKALAYAYQIATWPKVLPDILVPPPRSFLDLPFVNIDPPGCRDIDDAVAVVGNRIAIAIADVAAWLELNPWVRKSAEAMGQTMYVDGKAVRPMLPSALSEDKASLVPGQRRPAAVLMFVFDPDEGIRDMDLVRCDIRVRNSYSYGTAEYITELPVGVLADFAEFVLGEETEDPHKWVEALMVFYNQAVAHILAEKGEGLLRAQSEPDAEKLARYTTICADTAYLASSAAEYVPAAERKEHFMFQSLYTHVTSPLRRYADVVNQCALFDVPLEYDLDVLNAREKRLKKFNRDLQFLEALQFPVQPLAGVVLEQKEDHCRVWVGPWKRVVSVPRTDLAIGERVVVKYHLNMEPMSWKRRLVVEVS